MIKKFLICTAAALLTAGWGAPRALATEASFVAAECASDVTQGRAVTILNQGKSDGADLILIPGLSTPRAVWDTTAARLRSTHRLHIVQVRGFGDEAVSNADGPVLPHVVADVRNFIDNCIAGQGRAAPAIIGHSMGGLTGLIVAAQAPDSIGRLMIVDALPFIGTLFGQANVEAIRPQADAMVASMRAAHGKATAPTSELSDDAKIARARTNVMARGVIDLERIGEWMAASDARVVAQVFHDVMTTDMRGELSQVKAPVTLVYAQDDELLPAARVQSLFEPAYAGIARFKAVMVPQSRHFIMLDQPEAFAKTVDSFLAD